MFDRGHIKLKNLWKVTNMENIKKMNSIEVYSVI